MAVRLDRLRERIRARGVAMVEYAAASLVAALYEAAGSALPPGAVVQEITSGPTLIVLRIRVDDDQVAQVGTVWEWVTGEPDHPFHPHQRLDGLVFDESNWRDLLAVVDGSFPAGGYYYPGDHKGCQCRAEIVLGSLVFDPSALDAQPIVVRAFGVDVLVTPPAPERAASDDAPAWWTATINPEGWRRALEEALVATA